MVPVRELTTREEMVDAYKASRLRMEMAGIEAQLRRAERRKAIEDRAREAAKIEEANIAAMLALDAETIQRLRVGSEASNRVKEIRREVVTGRLFHGQPMTVADLLGPNRESAVVRARQYAMWRIKQETNWSLPRIGRAFGGRDHTTVLHALRQIEKKGIEHFEAPR